MARPPESKASGASPLVREVDGLRARVSAWRARGETVALVPTMGALHEGHMALVRGARRAARRTIVSLFVNPLQFGPGEDYAAYPRDEADDRVRLGEAGVDVLFAPSAEVMYPEGFSSAVSVAGLTEGLCGAHRPGHFEGVATVVTKLFLQCQPDFALFGEKDYQQLLMVRRLVRDLDLPLEVIAVPTVRDSDGLALSSRNALLTEPERAVALQLNRVLAEIACRLADGRSSPGEAIEWGIGRLEAAGFEAVDYVAVCDAETLSPLERLSRPARVLAAVRIGRVRLIDNLPAEPAGSN